MESLLPGSSRSTDRSFASPHLQFTVSSALNVSVHSLIDSVDRNVNESFSFNQETQFVPILGLMDAQLNETKPTDSKKSASSIQDNHHPALLALLAEELSVAPEEIHDFELLVK